MNGQSWREGLRLTGAFLLLLALAVSLIGGSFLRVRLIPEAEGAAFAGADHAAYRDGSGKTTSVIYERALSQTVFLRWEKKNETGETEGVVSGSGIILSVDGYILTNAHCVADAQAAGETPTVELCTGEQYDCVIVGADTDSDIALLKIEAAGLYPAVIGRMEELAPCQNVYVMGHPDEMLKYTITSGIISGLDRTITFEDGTILDMFQIDAAVNPGNSGGPVYNVLGQVIGVATAKYATLMTEGIGFAIPMEKAVELAGDLKQYGYVRNRPLMGIIVRDAAAGDFGEASPAGALVYSVEEGLCGDKAGLQAGDVIVALNGVEISSMQELLAAKRSYHAFDTVELKIWRNGKILTRTLTFEEVTPEHPTGRTEIVEETPEPLPGSTEEAEPNE